MVSLEFADEEFENLPTKNESRSQRVIPNLESGYSCKVIKSKSHKVNKVAELHHYSTIILVPTHGLKRHY